MSDERMEQLAKLVGKGAILRMAPDVWVSLREGTATGALREFIELKDTIPIKIDRHAPPGTIYAVDPDYLKPKGFARALGDAMAEEPEARQEFIKKGPLYQSLINMIDGLDEDMIGDCDECREWRILMRKDEEDPESRWLCKMCMETCDE